MRSFVCVVLTLLIQNFGVTYAAETYEYKLDNGLKILVREDHRAPVVVSQIWYKVGASSEYDGTTGISHALEHMMFKGTPDHPAGEFSRIISANGGDENAFTGSDYTAYFQTLEKSRLPIAFELEADRMQNLLVPPEEFKKEIEVVKEERRWRTDDSPESFTYEVFMSTAFQTSPYRQPVIGWMSDLDNLTAEKVKQWYKHWYAPNNATLVVVGDVNPDDVYQLAKKYFGPIPSVDINPGVPRPEVEQNGIKRIVVKRPAELPYLIMGYKAPSLTESQRQPEQVPETEVYALEVLSGILDGGDSARFKSILVREKEVASSVNLGFSFASKFSNVLTIDGVPAQGKTVDDLEAAIREQLQRIKTEPVSDEELERVKTQVVADDIYQKDSIFYQAMIMGTLETVGLDWRVADEYVEKVKQVTADQIKQVANKYFNDDDLTIAVLDPQPIDPNKPATQPRGDMEHVR